MAPHGSDRLEQYDLDELYANTWTEQDRRDFENQPISQKSFLIAWALALFLGPFGAQRYYLGRWPTALLKSTMFIASVLGFVLGSFGIATTFLAIVSAWTLIDLFLLLSGTMGDAQHHRLAGYAPWATRCAAVTILVLVSLLVVALVVGTSAGVTGD